VSLVNAKSAPSRFHPKAGSSRALPRGSAGAGRGRTRGHRSGDAATDQETLRGLGLSRRKADTVLDLARRFRDGRLSEAELRELPDDEVIKRLTKGSG
jgi:hypothetical protein